MSIDSRFQDADPPCAGGKFPGYLGNLVGPEYAAEVLFRYLGESVRHWLDFLSDNRHPRHEDPAFAYELHEGDFAYYLIDIYLFIRMEAPHALNWGELTKPRDVNRFGFRVDVYTVIDFDDGARPYVKLDFPDTGHNPNGLTPKEARAIAATLVHAADQCESDFPNHILGTLDVPGFEVPPVKKAGRNGREKCGSRSRKFAQRTDDKELDQLLRDLGPK